MTPRLVLPLLLALGAPTAFAQTQPASDSAPANWDALAPADREMLVQPLRDRWNSAGPKQRARMLEHARRWRDMPPGQRERAHVGMRRFHRLDPEQQAQLKVLFDKTRGMDPRERREAFALFHAMRGMTPSERDALRAKWNAMSVKERKSWMRAHAPRRGGPPPSP